MANAAHDAIGVWLREIPMTPADPGTPWHLRSRHYSPRSSKTLSGANGEAEWEGKCEPMSQ